MISPHRVFEGRFGRLHLVDITGSFSERSHPEPTILVKHSGPACELRAGDLRTSLGRGALLILNAGEPFAMTTEDSANPVRLLLFHASPDWLREKRASTLPLPPVMRTDSTTPTCWSGS